MLTVGITIFVVSIVGCGVWAVVTRLFWKEIMKGNLEGDFILGGIAASSFCGWAMFSLLIIGLIYMFLSEASSWAGLLLMSVFMLATLVLGFPAVCYRIVNKLKLHEKGRQGDGNSELGSRLTSLCSTAFKKFDQKSPDTKGEIYADDIEVVEGGELPDSILETLEKCFKKKGTIKYSTFKADCLKFRESCTSDRECIENLEKAWPTTLEMYRKTGEGKTGDSGWKDWDTGA
jgi:hypothetical protein